jgi:cell wall-associated NlpC family hydrolase
MTSPPLSTPLRTRLPRLPGVALLALALVAAAALALGLSLGTGHHPHAHAAPRSLATGPAQLVAEAPDPLASQSYPDPAGARSHARAAAPSVAAAAVQAPGAPTVAQVERELERELAIKRAQAAHHGSSGYVDPVSGAFSPFNVIPTVVAEVIAGGNAITDFPYVYGGGHASFIDRAYDCSGSVSYALAAGGLIAAPETSGQLEHWGAPGPGKWLTVFANAGHTFMNVDGVWFDTAGRAGPYSTRWLTVHPSLAGYVVRHYPGL